MALINEVDAQGDSPGWRCWDYPEQKTVGRPCGLLLDQQWLMGESGKHKVGPADLAAQVSFLFVLFGALVVVPT